jgi:hypothetical protein
MSKDIKAAVEQLAELPNEVTLTKEEMGVEPYSKREIKTMAQLLSLKIETLINDFTRETGAEVWHVRQGYGDRKVEVSVKLGEEYLY